MQDFKMYLATLIAVLLFFSMFMVTLVIDNRNKSHDMRSCSSNGMQWKQNERGHMECVR